MTRTTILRCFVCRKKMATVAWRDFPEAYDFCGFCETWMLRNMERDMLGLSSLPLGHKMKLLPRKQDEK